MKYQLKNFTIAILVVVAASYLTTGIVSATTTPAAQSNAPASSGLGQNIDSRYTPLEALPNDKGEISNASVDTSTFFTTIYFFSLTAAVFLAVIMIIVAGIQYMARGISESAAKGAKDRIKKALLGLVLALTSYLILKTINPQLVNPSLFVPAINVNPGLFGPSQAAPTQPSTTSTTGASVWGPGPYPQPQDPAAEFALIAADEQRVRKLLTPSGIKIVDSAGTSVPCSSYGQQNCTTVGLLPDTAINNLITMQTDCRCVEITAGTEWWLHDEHGPGRGIVDLQATPVTEAYVQSIATGGAGIATDKNGSYPYYQTSLGTFIHENDHWHVVMQ